MRNRKSKFWRVVSTDMAILKYKEMSRIILTLDDRNHLSLRHFHFVVDLCLQFCYEMHQPSFEFLLQKACYKIIVERGKLAYSFSNISKIVVNIHDR